MEKRVKIQIYTMQTIDEAQAVAALGVDHVGITPSNIGLPGEIDFETARGIADAVRNSVVSVALSVESNPDVIETMVQAVRPDILHLCGPENSLLPDAVGSLRERVPNLEIMQAISVGGDEAIDAALAYEEVAPGVTIYGGYPLIKVQREDNRVLATWAGGTGYHAPVTAWGVTGVMLGNDEVPTEHCGQALCFSVEAGREYLLLLSTDE